jgi:hypothetical protein
MLPYDSQGELVLNIPVEDVLAKDVFKNDEVDEDRYPNRS